MSDEKLLTLPWQMQVALGSGYAAYMLAYVGIRDHHKGIDVAFRAIAFGHIASATLYLTRACHEDCSREASRTSSSKRG